MREHYMTTERFKVRRNLSTENTLQNYSMSKIILNSLHLLKEMIKCLWTFLDSAIHWTELIPYHKAHTTAHISVFKKIYVANLLSK